MGKIMTHLRKQKCPFVCNSLCSVFFPNGGFFWFPRLYTESPPLSITSHKTNSEYKCQCVCLHTELELILFLTQMVVIPGKRQWNTCWLSDGNVERHVETLTWSSVRFSRGCPVCSADELKHSSCRLAWIKALGNGMIRWWKLWVTDIIPTLIFSHTTVVRSTVRWADA